MIRALAAAVALVATIGCGEVDTEDLDPIDDYPSWYSFTTEGNAPAHGDSVRVMYANDIARTYTGAGDYRLGSVIVKEIRQADDSDAIDYIAIMRRLETAPDGGELQGGWLFTLTDSMEDPERQGATCWDTCHVQAPYAGAWFDWGR